MFLITRRHCIPRRRNPIQTRKVHRGFPGNAGDERRCSAKTSHSTYRWESSTIAVTARTGQGKELKKGFALRLTGLAGVVYALGGCANVPSEPNTLADLQGSYDVIDQFSYKYTHATRIDVHFLPPDAQGKTQADLAIYDGERVQAFRLDDCGYPGDRIAHDIANSDAPHASEVVRCLNGGDRSRPVLFLIRSLDGHRLVFHPDGGLISSLTHDPIYSDTGLMAIINWAPVWKSGFVIKRADR